MLTSLRRVAFGLFIAGGLGYAGYGLAQSGAQVLTSLAGTENVACSSCTLSAVFSTATIAGYGRSTGLLYTTTGTASNTGTPEQTLATYSLPANTLNVGTKLRILASFTGATGTDNKTFKCYFGASVISSGVLTTNNKNGSCELIVTKIAANRQIVYGNMLVDTTPITGYEVVGTDTDTSAITIKFTGTGGTPGVITVNDFSVERLGK